MSSTEHPRFVWIGSTTGEVHPPPLIIVEQNAFLAELFSEHAILGSKVLDHVLLSMVDPAGEDKYC